MPSPITNMDNPFFFQDVPSGIFFLMFPFTKSYQQQLSKSEKHYARRVLNICFNTVHSNEQAQSSLPLCLRILLVLYIPCGSSKASSKTAYLHKSQRILSCFIQKLAPHIHLDIYASVPFQHPRKGCWILWDTVSGMLLPTTRIPKGNIIRITSGIKDFPSAPVVRNW